eukprot:5248457-Amphidinium_carterae.1
MPSPQDTNAASDVGLATLVSRKLWSTEGHHLSLWPALQTGGPCTGCGTALAVDEEAVASMMAALPSFEPHWPSYSSIVWISSVAIVFVTTAMPFFLKQSIAKTEALLSAATVLKSAPSRTLYQESFI